jgi:drug/metabolite transporter (DMT)-like permease
MVVGLIAAVLAAFCYESGYVLQALEARMAPERHALRASLLMRLASRPRWVAGTALSLTGAVLQTMALAHAPITLVQPLIALGLVGLLAFAHFALGERVGRLELAGAGALIAGVAAIAVSAPARSDHISSVSALALIVGALGLTVLLPFVLRARGPLGAAVLGAAAGDALAVIALKLTGNALAHGRPALALLAAGGAVAAGGAALTAEMSALRRLPVTRVAPPVLAAQVVVPAIAAIAAFGEPAQPAVLAGVAAAGCGAALLGASGAITDLRAGPPEPEALAHDSGGAGQLRERVVS